MNYRQLLIVCVCMFLVSCSGGGDGGGAGSGSSSRAVNNATEVTVLLSKPTVATGAIGAQGYVPPGVQSMVVDVYRLDGSHLQGPFYANIPILNATFVAPNGSYDIRVFAFSGLNGTGIRWYDGAQKVALSGRPMLVTLKMNMKVTASASANVVSPGQSVTLTGQEAGQAPGASSPLIWTAIDASGVSAGTFAASPDFGGTIVWTPPNVEGIFRLQAQVDPTVNLDQDPTYMGEVQVIVKNQAPIVRFSSASVAVGTGLTSPAITVFATDPDPLDVITLSVAASAPAWVTLDPVAKTLVLTPPAGLVIGNYSVSIIGTDSFGMQTTAALTVAVYDATAPFIPSFNPIASPTNQTQPLISGLAEPSTTVTVYDAGAVLGSAAVNGLGNWSFVPAVPFVHGANVAFTAAATDLAGNISPISNVLNINIDTLAPTAPTWISPINNSVLPALISMTGTAEAGSTLTIYNGASRLGTSLANGAGSWTFNTPILADGVYVLTATATDVAGNSSVASLAANITLDSAPPARPTISSFAAVLTNNASPVLTGVAEAGSVVSVVQNGVNVGLAPVLADGSWSYTPVLPLLDAAYVFTATAKDAMGNVSAVSLPQTITIDTVPPTLPVINAPVAGNISTNVPTISGTAEAGSSISITGFGSALADAAGNWLFTLVDPLPNNVASALNVRASDGAGNISALVSLVVTPVIAPPIAPVVTTAAATVATSTPTVAGTATAGSSVTIISNGQIVATATTNAAGVWSATLNTAVANGSVLQAVVLGAGGSVSAAVAIPLTINAPLPTATLAVAAGATTSTSVLPVVSGVTSPYATLTISNGGNTVATIVADALGNFSAPIQTALANGTVNLTATVVDVAGNTSAVVAANAVLIDTVAPNAPVVTTASGIVTTATPIVSGTAEANASIEIANFGVLLGSVQASAAGAWAFTTPTLADGNASLTAVAVDAAGNSSLALPAVLLNVDTTAPVVPVLTAPTGFVASATPVITGIAEAGSRITLFNNGVALTAASPVSAAASGVWSFLPNTPFADGNLSLTATATDAAGLTSVASTSLTSTVDTVIAAPTLTSPIAGALLTSNAPVLTGTAEAAASVLVLDNNVIVGSTVADNAGNWSLTPIVALANNARVVVKAQDAAGNTASAAAVLFIINTTTNPPAAPVVTTPAAVVVSNTPTISGTTTANNVVTITSGTAVLATTTASNTGSWSATVTTPLSNGNVVLVATATDAAGNISAVSAPISLTINAPVPATPVLDPLPLTNQTAPVLSGSAAAGTTLNISQAGVTLVSLVVPANGLWASTPTLPLNVGSNTLTAVATDASGNRSLSANTSIIVDVAAPLAPVITSFVANQVVNTATPVIAGTSEANALVDVYSNAVWLGSVAASAAGSWTFTPNNILSNNATLTAVARDAAGNVSPSSAPLAIVVDTIAPVAASFAATTPSSTNQTALTLAGTAEAGLTVSLSLGGATVRIVADATGQWTTTLNLTAAANTITALVTDAAGNNSVASSIVITLDTLAPAAPTLSLPASNLFNSTTPTITGLAVAGESIRLTNKGLLVGTAIADATGAWSITAQTALPTGTLNLAATASDAAGNTSPAVTANPVVDVLAPTAPVVLSPANNSAVNSTPNVVLTGLAEANASVVLSDAGVLLGTALADATGAWTLTLPTPASGTVLNVLAVATDVAGNVGPSSIVQVITVDTLAPAAVPVINALPSAINTAQPVLTGTAIAGSTVIVSNNGVVIGSVLVPASGNWTLTPAAALTAPVSLTAVAQDAAGNTTAASAATTAILDILAPAAPVIAAASTATNITGTAEAGAVISLFNGGVAVGSVTASAAGTWSLTPSLQNGTANLTVTATDAAGNVSALSGVSTLLVDTVAPAAPVISPLPALSNIALTTISGVAEAASKVQLFANGVALAAPIVVAADGSWTSNQSLATNAAVTLSATSTDAAGNVSLLSSAAVTITIDTLIAAPVLTSLLNVTTNAPTITGTANAGDTISLSSGGSALVDANGNWSLTPTSALPSGVAVTLTANDAAGNTALTTATFTVAAVVAPVAPVFTSPAVVAVSSPTLTGTATVGMTVLIVDANNVVIGTAPVDAVGNWTFTPRTALVNGTLLSAIVQDAAGNVSVAAAVAVRINAPLPASPVVMSPLANSILNTTTLTLSGTAPTGATVDVFAGTVKIATTTAVGTAWTVTSAALLDGVHSFTALAVDAAGNTSLASAAVAATIDTTAPAIPVISSAPAAGSVIANSTPVIAGSAVTDAVSVQLMNGSKLLGTAAVVANAWTFTSPALADGQISLTVVARDSVGNLSVAAAPLAFVVDTAAPNTAVLTSIAANAAINTTTPISGVAEAGATVNVSNNGVLLGSSVVDAAGNWTFTPAALAVGAASLTMTVTDSVGNISAASAPVLATVWATPSIPTINANAGGTTTAPVLSGMADANVTVVLDNGGVNMGSALADNAGNWSFAANSTIAITPATTNITATVTTAGGTAAATSAVAVAATTTFSPVITTASTTITASTQPVIQGSAVPLSTVTVYVNGSAVGTTLVDGAGAWRFTFSALSNATYNITTTASAGGVVSAPSAALSLQVAAALPTTPTLAVVAISASGTVNNNPVQITGTAADGVITVRNHGVVIGSATAAAGVWSLSVGFAEGASSLTASLTDLIGNVSTVSGAVSFTVDTLPPAQPLISTTTASTNVAAQSLTGSAEAWASVRLNTGQTTLANAAGVWSMNVTLVAGVNTFTVTATDAAGNTSISSAAQNILLDTLAPSITINALLSPSNTAQPTISGVAEVGAVVQVLAVAATVNASGVWSIVPATALVEGINTITAIATDAVGNSNSTTLSYTLDTQPPAVAISTASGTINASGVVSGTAETGAVVDVRNHGIHVFSTIAALGTWSFTPSTVVGDSTLSLTAVATDAVGNVSLPTAAVTLVLDSTAAAKPVISSPIANAHLNTATPTISGTSDANAVVDVYAGATKVLTVTASALGVWSGTASALTDTTYTLVAYATDSVGNVSPVSASITGVVIDTIAPVISSPLADVYVESALGIAISATLAQPIVSDAVGASSITSNAPVSPATFSMGLTTITWSAADAAGNAAVAVAQNIYVRDTTAPNAVVLSSPVAGLTNINALTISGTAENNAVIDVYAGTTWLQQATATGVNFSFNLAALADAAYTINVYASDALGNRSLATAVNITLDTAAPANAPIINNPAALYVGALTFSGYNSPAEPYANIQIFDGVSNALLGAVTADNVGDWSYSDARSVDGSYQYYAKITDQAGNSNTTASNTVTLNLDATAPIVVAPANYSIEATGLSMSLSQATIFGAFANPATAPAATDPYANDLGFGYLTLSSNISDPYTFSVGNTTVRWSATDGAGNTTTALQSVSITDTTAPVFANIPAALTMVANSAGGVSDAYSTVATFLSAPTANDVVDGGITLTDNITNPYTFAVGQTTTVIWTAQDAQNNTATASQSITVSHSTPVFTAPSPTSPYTWTFAEDSAATITVAASNVDADTVSYSLNTAGISQGSAAIDALTGVITYTPVLNVNGNAGSMIVSATDSAGGTSSTLSISLNITAVNDAPTLAGTAAITPAPALVGNTLTASGITASDVDGVASLHYIWRNGLTTIGTDSPSYVLTSNEAHSTAISVDIYATDNGTPSLQSLINTSATIALNNSAPSQEVFSLPSGVAPSILYRVGDTIAYTQTTASTDADGDAISLAHQWQRWNGTTYVDIAGATGTTYVVASADYAAGTVRLSIIASDAYTGVTGGVSATATVVSNTTPAVATATITLLEDANVTFTPVVSDADLPDDSYTFNVLSQPANGTVLVVGGSSLKYTPNANWNGIESLSYQVTDTYGAVSNTATATLTVSGVNDVPTLASNAGITMLEDATATTITNTALKLSDVDNPTSQLTYTITSIPTKGVLKNNGVQLAANSTFSQADIDNSLLRFTPSLNANGADSFGFSFSDGTAPASANQTFNLTITAVNDLPVIAGALNIAGTAQVGQSLTVSGFSISDADADPYTVVYVWKDDAVVIAGANTASYTLAASNVKGSVIVVDVYAYETLAPANKTSTLTTSTTILNAVPVMNAVAVNIGLASTASIAMGATDADVSDTLTYSIYSAPTLGTSSIDSATGVVTYLTLAGFGLTDSIGVQVSDGTAVVQATASIAIVEPVGTSPGFTWLGSVDTDWSNGGNWSNGVAAPTLADNVFIPQQALFQPALTLFANPVGNIVAETGTTLSTLAFTFLQVYGDAILDTVIGVNVEMIALSVNQTQRLTGDVPSLTLSNGGNANHVVQLLQATKIQGDIQVFDGSVLDVNGQVMDVYGNLIINNNSVSQASALLLNKPNDLLRLHAGFIANNASVAGSITAGSLQIAGDFNPNHVTAYMPSGTHKTIFNGTAAQVMEYGAAVVQTTCADVVAGALNDVEVRDGALVSWSARYAVNGTLDVLGTGKLAPVTPDKGVVCMQNFLPNLDNYANYSVFATDLSGNTTVQMTQDVALLQHLIVGDKASLDLNGKRLDVYGTLDVFNDLLSQQSGLIMQNANDVLRTHGNWLHFTNPALAGSMTNGVLHLGGDFAANADAFVPSALHKTLLDAAAAQTVSLWGALSTAGNHFEYLDIYSATVNWGSDVLVNKVLASPSAYTPALVGANNLLTVNGGLDIDGMVIDHTRLQVNGATPVNFDAVQFSNFLAADKQMTLNFTGATQTWNNIVFDNVPTTGWFIDAVGNTGNVITLSAATPAYGLPKVNGGNTYQILWGSNSVPSVSSPATNPYSLVMDENVSNHILISFVDTDVTAGMDSLSYTVTPRAGATVGGTASTTTTASSLDFTFTPNANANGSIIYDIVATDSFGSSVTQVVTVTVNAVNSAPTIAGTAAISPTANVVVGSTLTASGVTAADIDGVASLHYVWRNNGVVMGIDASTYTLTTNEAHSTNITVDIYATDDGVPALSSATSSTSTAVTVINSIPTSHLFAMPDGLGFTKYAVGDTVPYATTTTASTDADGDVITLVYQWQRWNGATYVNVDAYGSAQDYIVTGADQIDPNGRVAPYAGIVRLEIYPTDAYGGVGPVKTGGTTATINTAPTLNLSVTSSAVIATPFQGDVLTANSGLTDVDLPGQTVAITYAWKRDAVSGNCAAAATTIATTQAYTLTNTDVGNFVCVLVTANDGIDAAVSASLVTAAAVATSGPIATKANVSLSTSEDTALLIDVNSLFTDGAAPSALTFSAAGAPIVGTLSAAGNATITYTPLANWNSQSQFYAAEVGTTTTAVDSFTLTASDGILTASVTVTMDVYAVADLAVAVGDTLTVAQGTSADVFANDSNVDPVEPVFANVINGSWKWVATSATAGSYVADAAVMPFFDVALNPLGAAWPAGGKLNTLGSLAKTYAVEYKIAKEGTTEGWNTINYDPATTYLLCDSANSTVDAVAVRLFEDYGISAGDTIKIRTTGFFHASRFSWGALSTGLGAVFSSSNTIPQNCNVTTDRFETVAGNAATSTTLPSAGPAFNPQAVTAGVPVAPNSFEISPTFVESSVAWGGPHATAADASAAMIANARGEFSIRLTVPDPGNATPNVYLYFVTQDAKKSDNAAVLNDGTQTWPLKIEIIKVTGSATANITVQ